MISSNKIDGELELALNYYGFISSSIFSEDIGVPSSGPWELIVKYHGDIQIPAQSVGAKVEVLNENFATLTMDPMKIVDLVSFFEIEYVTLPKRLFYIIRESAAKACITNIHNTAPYNLRGRGVLLGIIDSGITYTHPDFQNEDGTTRIAYLWDQTIKGTPPTGFSIGTEYTREQINEALTKPTSEEKLAIVPSVDSNGHGTAVAGVTGGNGKASEGREVGVAPEAEFVIVKVGMEGKEDFIRTIEIMKALQYVIAKANLMGKPIAINIGFGMNAGGHDGRTLIEIYTDQMARRAKCSIVVGTGNLGDRENHTSGVVAQGEEKEISFIISEGQSFYAFTLWQSFIDVFDIKITSPTREQTDRISPIPTNQSYIVGTSNIFINFSQPSSINTDVSRVVYIQAQEGNITPGIWTITIYGVEITDGRYNIWGAAKEFLGVETTFLEPTTTTTITIPATGYTTISVGAFNGATNQIAPFSGRGFTRDNRVKPDLVAPGVDVITTDNKGGYSPATGTSIASAFVAGGAAVMMEWGIVNGNDPTLYGDRLSGYLLRNTRRIAPNIIYPDPSWGYGAFCLEDALDKLRLT